MSSEKTIRWPNQGFGIRRPLATTMGYADSKQDYNRTNPQTIQQYREGIQAAIAMKQDPVMANLSNRFGNLGPKGGKKSRRRNTIRKNRKPRKTHKH